MKNDQNLRVKVGDLAVTYNSGYHRVLEIQERHDAAPLITYEWVLMENGRPVPGKPGKRKPNKCDAAFCYPVTRELIERDYEQAIEAAQLKRDNLLKLIEEKQDDHN